jgi:hypothetical protein
VKLMRRDQWQTHAICHDPRSLLWGDFVARMNGYRIALTTGLATQNEMRRREGDNGIGPDGDQTYLPANLARSADMAAGKAPPAPAAPPGSDHTGSAADAA